MAPKSPFVQPPKGNETPPSPARPTHEPLSSPPAAVRPPAPIPKAQGVAAMKAARARRVAEEAEKERLAAEKEAEEKARRDAEEEVKRREEKQERERRKREEDEEKRRALAEMLTGIDDDVFEEELTLEHEGKHRNGIEYITTLPDHFKFKERGYDPSLKLVTEDYRGADLPSWATGLGKKRPVILSFSADDNDLDFKNSDELMSFGSMIANSSSGTDCIRMRMHLDTQYPSIEVFIERFDKTQVSWRVFPNSFSSVDTGASLEWHFGESLDRDWVDVNNEEIVTSYNKFTMSQTLMHLKEEGSANSSANLLARRPIWRGDLSETQILAIVDDYKKASSDGTLEHFPYADIIIAKLHIAKWVGIMRFLEVKHRQEFQKTMEFYKRCLDMCMRYGNLWFYGKNLNIKRGETILNRPHLWVDAPMPRWLVKEWAVNRNEVGEIIEVVPSRMARFRHPGVFPDKYTAASAHTLALARGCNSIIKSIQDRLDKEAYNIDAVFSDYWDAPGKYSVQIVCNLQDALLTGQSLIPEAGTPITIQFRDSSNKTWTFRGAVVPTFLNTAEVTFSAIVQAAGVEHYEFQDDEVVKISVKLKQDNKSIGRQFAAFKQAAAGPQRAPGQGGPDFMRILMDAPPQDSSVPTNPWIKSLTDDERTEFMRIMKEDRGANKGQAEVAELLLTDENGACVVIAPPGTGKTKTGGDLLTTIHDVMQKRNKEGEKGVVQHPLLICAPSNMAVDEILRKLIARDASIGGMNAIRFRGARIRAPKKGEAPESSEEKDTRQLTDYWWDAMEYMSGLDYLETDFGDHEFAVNFSKTLKRWAKHGSAHPFADQARTYTGMQSEMMTNPKANKKALRESMEALEGTLQQEYFKTVDAVFVTFNSAMHPALVEYFHPKGLFADEAAMGNLGDYMTAITSNWDTLEHAIFIGDPNQQHARAMEPNRNEFGNLQSHSFMQKVQEEGGKDVKFVQLTEQWRMHPQISGPVNSVFYNGTMTDHPSTMLLQEIQVTAASYFQELFGAAYKGWYRFGISLDYNEHNKSELFMQTTSSFNKGEAEAIVQMIKGLLAHPPPPGGRKIEPEDILITTPYTGMSTHLWRRCKQEGIFGSGKNTIRIWTGAAVQGQEGKIQFLSFTVNTEGGLDKLRFLGEQHQFDVLVSRAQYMQVLSGQFVPLVRAAKKGELKLFTNKKSGLYHFGQYISTLWPDENIDNCIVIDSNEAYNALWKNKPATKPNSFPGRINFVPKRKTLDGKPTELQKANYGHQPEGPDKKKAKSNSKRSKAPKPPKNSSSKDLIEKLQKPMTTDEQKSLNDLLERTRGKAKLEKEYMALERSNIDKSAMSPQLKAVFRQAIQEVYQDKLSSKLTEETAKLNLGPMTLDQCLSKLNTIPLENTQERWNFLDSLPSDMKAKVNQAREETTRRNLNNATLQEEDEIDWDDNTIPEDPSDAMDRS